MSSGGYEYWTIKIRHIIKKIRKEKNWTWLESQKFLSTKIAMLELIPYHSRKFGEEKIVDQLESVKAMREYLHKILIPKANEGEILIIATRSVKKWLLDNISSSNIVLYDSQQARGGSLGEKSAGYQKIIEKLGF